MKEVGDEMQVINNRINEMADTLEAENRERTAAEDKEFNELTARRQVLQMRANSMGDYNVAVAAPVNGYDRLQEQIRELMHASKRYEAKFTRDTLTTSSAGTDGSVIAIKAQDVIEPLREGFILDKVGLPFYTGLSGTFIWPLYTKVGATIYGEDGTISDSEITFSSLTATPERIAAAIPVTRTMLNQTEGLVEGIIRKELPLSLQDILNEVTFTPTKLSSATNLVGPFVDATEVTLSETPTATELANMKATILKTGIKGEKLCWIMTKSMEAILEVTPVNSNGIFVPMAQDHRLLGLPIYTTQYIDGYIGLGDFIYQPMGLFGEISLIVDPYSLARQNSVDFVIDADYATKTLRQNAFLKGAITVAE